MEPACQKETPGQQLVQIDPLPKPKRYKPSRFNARSTAKDGTLILYNSFTGHRCGLPSAAAKAAQVYLSRAGVQEPLGKLGEYLLRKGYIVEDSVDENLRFDMRYSYNQFRSDNLELILLSSEECNFRCVYCSQEFKRDTMIENVRTGVKNLVTKRIKKLNALSVSWFGGEPLLGYEAIEDLAPALQASAEKNDVPYQASITTNGYLLTPERSAAMVNWGILSYQITIDGTAEYHDQHRPLKEGGGTFHKIFDNIVAMKRLEKDFEVRVRVNFDYTNAGKLEPLFEMLKQYLADDKRYMLAFHPVGKWGGPNDEKLQVCGLTDSDAYSRKMREQARALGLKSEKLSFMLEPEASNVCYAARPYNLIIGADGKLMKCTVVLDTHQENVVGYLREDGELTLDYERLFKWVKPYYQSDTTCQKCFFVPVCQGASCPLPRVVSGERPCPPAKLRIQQTLNDVWEEENQSGIRTSTQAEPTAEQPCS